MIKVRMNDFILGHYPKLMDLCLFISAMSLSERCRWTSPLVFGTTTGSLLASPSMRVKKLTIPILRIFLTLTRSLDAD